MFVVKDELIFNMDHVLRVEKGNETDGDICAQLFFIFEKKPLILDFTSFKERDLAFLSIMQSLSRDVTVCYLDSDTSKYLVDNLTDLKPRKKRNSLLKDD